MVLQSIYAVKLHDLDTLENTNKLDQLINAKKLVYWKFHFAADSACLRSAIKSSGSSIPMEIRTTFGAEPAATCCSSVNCLWVVDAVCITSDRLSPRFGARLSRG